MNNFIYHNPTKILFGKNTLSSLGSLLEGRNKIMLLYGNGSIKKNGVYDQIHKVIPKTQIIEFGGIEPNPDYQTLMKAVDLCKIEKVDFLLAAGGGSVIDGAKFIAAAYYHDHDDPWSLLTQKSNIRIKQALPIGTILTLSGTGSEMNGYAVISRRERFEKLSFGSELLFPEFSILDPSFTLSLEKHQVANGIIDTFIHVCEQYITYQIDSPLQDRFSESILKTLIDESQRYLNQPDNYDNRANLMWCSTQALNGMLGCGVPQDWTTHNIGHELTALYGLDHARSLAVIWPALMKQQKLHKYKKIIQYGKNVWDIDADDEDTFNFALEKTVNFFRELGFVTTLNEYKINNNDFEKISSQILKRGGKLGEKKNIGSREIIEILELCLK